MVEMDFITSILRDGAMAFGLAFALVLFIALILLFVANAASSGSGGRLEAAGWLVPILVAVAAGLGGYLYLHPHALTILQGFR